MIGVAEIATMLGVSRQRVHQLASAPGFPVPIHTTAGAHIRLWRRADIVEWAQRTGRTVA